MFRSTWILLATSIVPALALSSAHADETATQPAKPPVARKATPAKTSAVKAAPTSDAVPPTAPEAAAQPEPVAVPTSNPELDAKPLPVVETQVSSRERRESEERYIGYGKTNGFLGDFPIGPTVSILQIPHPLQVGLEGKYLDIAGFSGMYGVLPKITVNSISAKLDSWDVRARWFPFRGAFFIGAAYGQQKLTGTKSQSVSYTAAGQSATVNLAAQDEIKTNYVTPHLGWRWVTNAGFFYGMEFGWQFAMNSSAAVTTNQDALFESTVKTYDPNAYKTYSDLKNDIEDKSNKIGKTGLPHLSLIQIGWYF